jgi:membrane protein implicated in regulation of membrane protease activity
MTQAGLVMLAVGLVLMAFFTVLTLWYVPKVLAPTEHEHDEDEQRPDGGTTHV